MNKYGNKFEDYIEFIKKHLMIKFKMRKGSEDIEDVVQDVYLMTERFPFEEKRGVKYTTYLLNIVGYTYHNFIKHKLKNGLTQTRKVDVISDDEILKEEVVDSNLIEEIDYERMLKHLESYPLLSDYYFKERTLKDMSKDLGLTIEGVRKRIKKEEERFRKERGE